MRPLYRVELRPTTSAEVRTIASLEADLAYGPSWPWSARIHRKLLKDANVGHFVIHRGVMIAGYVVLADIADPAGNVRLRRLLTWNPNRVVWSAAIHAVLRMCFVDWSAVRLWACTDDLDPALPNLLHDLGFRPEGPGDESSSHYITDQQRVISVLAAEYARRSPDAMSNPPGASS